MIERGLLALLWWTLVVRSFAVGIWESPRTDMGARWPAGPNRVQLGELSFSSW